MSEAGRPSFSQHTSDVLWIADLVAQRLEYVSPGLERLWGVPADQIAADPASMIELVHTDDRPQFVEARSMAARGEPLAIEYRIVRPDGSIRHVRDSGFPIRNEAGQVTRIGGISQDITDERATIQGLTEGEERFREWVNAMPHMVWLTLPDGYNDFFSQRWYEYTGVPEGSTDGVAWRGLFHADDVPRVEACCQNSLATGAPYEMEYRLRHRSGEYRWVLGRALPIRDAGGAIVRWIGTCTDIDQSKRTSDELARASALLRLIGDSTPDVIYAKDRDSRLLYANAAIQKLLGKPPQELLGQSDLDWTNSTEAEAIIANDRRVLETGATVDVDESVTAPDGEVRYFRSVKSPLRDASGGIIGVVSITSDTTERRRAEERERLLAREVDHRAKNLLAVVQSVVLLTQADDVASFTRAITGRIQSLARAHSLLAASRWEGADLKQIVSDELAPYAGDDIGRVRMRGAAIRLKPEAAQALALVVHELATNSAKYGSLSAEAGRLDVTWVVSVANNGGGELRLRWRERGGPRVTAPTRRGFGSTILRASIERQLKGKFSVDWRPVGLVCEIAVPADQLSGAIDTSVGDMGALADGLAGGTINGLRILVVEDEALIAMQIENALSALGCEVVGLATRLADAFDMFYASSVDAVLLDVNVAGEQSYPFADLLRTKRVPFMFVSGYDAGSTLPERFRGMPSLVKPFAPSDLMGALERLGLAMSADAPAV